MPRLQERAVLHISSKMFHVEHSVERTVENASNCFGFKFH